MSAEVKREEPSLDSRICDTVRRSRRVNRIEEYAFVGLLVAPTLLIGAAGVMLAMGARL